MGPRSSIFQHGPTVKSQSMSDSASNAKQEPTACDGRTWTNLVKTHENPAFLECEASGPTGLFQVPCASQHGLMSVCILHAQIILAYTECHTVMVDLLILPHALTCPCLSIIKSYQINTQVESLERRYTCGKCKESRKPLCFFNDSWFRMFESRLAKAAGAEVAVQQRHERWHAAVAQSTFASQNVQNTSAPEQFLKIRCPKMARRCGGKRVCKSKCAKHRMFGPLFEALLSKN